MQYQYRIYKDENNKYFIKYKKYLFWYIYYKDYHMSQFKSEADADKKIQELIENDNYISRSKSVTIIKEFK